MRWQTTAVLAAILIALGAFYYVYEVRLGPERGGMVASAVEELLLLSDEPEPGVVQQDHLHGDLLLGGRRELLQVHEQAAVAGEADDGTIRRRERRADRRRQAEPHRA